MHNSGAIFQPPLESGEFLPATCETSFLSLAGNENLPALNVTPRKSSRMLLKIRASHQVNHG